MSDIDHAGTAAEYLAIADEVGGWLDEVADPQKQWAISQFNQAATAHALLAIVEELRAANEFGWSK